MAAKVELLNRMDGRVAAIRALASEDIKKGSIVCITGVQSGPVVSLADCQHKKKGLLLVALTNVNAGQTGRFCSYMLLPLPGEAKSGDGVYLGKKGKWSLRKLKTSIQVGMVLPGKGSSLYALIAPQGRY